VLAAKKLPSKIKKLVESKPDQNEAHSNVSKRGVYLLLYQIFRLHSTSLQDGRWHGRMTHWQATQV